MKIALAADHAGFEYKDRIVAYLQGKGHAILDYGTWSETPVDYPDYGFVVGESVATGQADRGIVVCGSSLGIAIAANKVAGVRCAAVFEPYSTELSRRHNDANVLALSQRLSGWEMAVECIDVFMETEFDGGRHTARVRKLNEYGQLAKAKTLRDLERGKVEGAETPQAELASH